MSIIEGEGVPMNAPVNEATKGLSRAMGISEEEVLQAFCEGLRLRAERFERALRRVAGPHPNEQLSAQLIAREALGD